jgi:hypothetical protein
VTATVDTTNVALVAPAATITLAGTVAAAVLLLDKLTTTPPAGAAPVSLTVAVDVFPPVTVVGFSVIVESAAGLTVRAAVFVTSPYTAEMVDVLAAITALLVTANVAVVAPAATVTFAGTVDAAVLLLDRVTTAPPTGAAAVSETLAVDVAPPVTVVGFSVNPASTGADVPPTLNFARNASSPPPCIP